MQQAAARDAGFSLIETIVALAVFTACYVLVQQSIAGSWRLVRAAHAEEAALAVAQRQLALAGVETQLVEGSSSGSTADGYTWTVDISRYVAPGEQAPVASPLAGYWVDVTVRWKESALRPMRSLSLKSIRLAVTPDLARPGAQQR